MNFGMTQAYEYCNVQISFPVRCSHLALFSGVRYLIFSGFAVSLASYKNIVFFLLVDEQPMIREIIIKS
jgi:hypothetical protein